MCSIQLKRACGLLLFVALFLYAPTMQAQELFNRHHIEISVGEMFSSSWGLNGMFVDDKKEYVTFETWAGNSRPYTLPKGVNGYESGWITPTISLSYYYSILKWLEIGGELSTMSKCDTEHYLFSDQVYAYYLHSNFYIAAGVRFAYFHKNITDLYSGLTLGANVRFHSTESTSLLLTTARFTWQVTALGIRFGKQVYGNIEIGYGYKGMLSAGIGCRF